MPGIKQILSSYLWNEWVNEFVVEWVYIHFPPGAWLVDAEVALTVPMSGLLQKQLRSWCWTGVTAWDSPLCWRQFSLWASGVLSSYLTSHSHVSPSQQVSVTLNLDLDKNFRFLVLVFLQSHVQFYLFLIAIGMNSFKKLRWNAYNIKLIILKSTNQWHLMHSKCFITMTSV